uniref:Polyketide synthase n=1 Tax=Peronospora matthiolae TaxID=2874970 RepID=A0AAV1V9B3_9STRA
MVRKVSSASEKCQYDAFAFDTAIVALVCGCMQRVQSAEHVDVKSGERGLVV